MRSRSGPAASTRVGLLSSSSSVNRTESRRRPATADSPAPSAPHSAASSVTAPKQDADGVTIGPSEASIAAGALLEVAGVRRDQTTAPLLLREFDPVAAGASNTRECLAGRRHHAV